MAAASNLDQDALIRRLASVFRLTDEEREAIRALPLHVAELSAEQDIVRQGDRPSRCCVVLDGFAAIHKFTGEGKRQILALQIRGDVPDLLSLHLQRLDCGVSALTDCRVGFVRHDAVRELCRQQPRIGDALWRMTLIDAAIFREWATNLGQRDAYSRMAHLLCETLVRLQAVGIGDGRTCPFPFSQAALADMTGITAVHVNRTLQQLRRSGLIELENRALTALDWDGLVEAGDFDPAYLHLVNGSGPH